MTGVAESALAQSSRRLGAANLRPKCVEARAVCSGEQCGVAIEVDRPALLDAVADAFPAGSVAVEVAVLELDTGPVVGLGGEADLDLAGEVGVGLESARSGRCPS